MLTKRLEVNGREYVNVAEAAEHVGYTHDYVKQLARGKWIDASVVNGEYFIDLQSLTHFIALAEQDRYEKEQQRDRHMRAEAILKHSTLGAKEMNDDAWVVFTKTGVVTLCGLLVGVLAWTSYEEGVEVSDVMNGSALAWQLLTNTIGGAVQQVAASIMSVWKI